MRIARVYETVGGRGQYVVAEYPDGFLVVFCTVESMDKIATYYYKDNLDCEPRGCYQRACKDANKRALDHHNSGYGRCLEGAHKWKASAPGPVMMCATCGVYKAVSR